MPRMIPTADIVDLLVAGDLIAEYLGVILDGGMDDTAQDELSRALVNGWRQKSSELRERFSL